MLIQSALIRCTADAIGVPLHQVIIDGKSYICRDFSQADAEATVRAHLAAAKEAKDSEPELL